MPDDTEDARKVLTYTVNSAVQSDNEDNERKRLEEKYGQVWDTDELQKEFTVDGFLAPFVIVKRKADGKKGTMMFQHRPRFYFGFQEAQQ